MRIAALFLLITTLATPALAEDLFCDDPEGLQKFISYLVLEDTDEAVQQCFTEHASRMVSRIKIVCEETGGERGYEHFVRATGEYRGYCESLVGWKSTDRVEIRSRAAE